MIGPHVAPVAVLIVGYRNSADIETCLGAISRTVAVPGFDVFICENGGAASYRTLLSDLIGQNGPCAPGCREGCDEWQTIRMPRVERLRLKTTESNVWVGCAAENLGYAGGINAWLTQLLSADGWKGIWILNPDTEPSPGALAALMQRAESAGKGMVGSTIIDSGRANYARIRGGLHWQRLLGRCVAIGRGERMEGLSDIGAIEAAMDSASGCSMYVTRGCVEKIGPMDERYFLFFEDLDWGIRAKPFGLGYASDSHVEHQRGTTTGSAKTLSAIPKLSVYLEHRNSIHFVRAHFAWTLPIRIAASLLYSLRFLLAGAPHNFSASFQGLLAGLRGEIGRPGRYRDP
jgi:GT2 family glycosyltransferase